MKIINSIGMDEKIIKIIKLMYMANKIQFNIGNINTEWLENSVGVQQGCGMHPTIFNIYMEKLFVRIRRSGKEVSVGNGKLRCLAYGNDVVLVAERKRGMEDLLEIIRKYREE